MFKRILLKELLQRSTTNDSLRIEFGDPRYPGGAFSCIRIRYMQTAGGMQFRICQLFNGSESGGIYKQNIEDAMIQAVSMVDRYMNSKLRLPTNIRQKIEESKRNLIWFSFTDGAQRKHHPKFTMEELDKEFPGTQTIELQ